MCENKKNKTREWKIERSKLNGITFYSFDFFFFESIFTRSLEQYKFKNGIFFPFVST